MTERDIITGDPMETLANWLEWSGNRAALDRVGESDIAMDAFLALLKGPFAEWCDRQDWNASPCPGLEECRHSDEEHRAFDIGFRDGEKGIDPEDCPYVLDALPEGIA